MVTHVVRVIITYIGILLKFYYNLWLLYSYFVYNFIIRFFILFRNTVHILKYI